MNGESHAVHGIFVSRIKQGIVREFFYFIQGSEHFFGRPFKQAAYAEVEQSVAGKQRFVVGKVPENVAAGVSVNFDDFGFGVTQHPNIAVFDRFVKSGDTVCVVFGANDSGMEEVFDFKIGVGMIIMMMRVKNVGRFTSELLTTANDGFRFRRINNGRDAGCLVGQQVRVIVHASGAAQYRFNV